MLEDLPLLTEDEERIMEEGTAAQTLLDDPAFLRAVERVRSQCAEGILTSRPEQGAIREQAYNLSRGLSAVTEELLTMAALGLTVLDNATRPTDDDVQAEEPDTPSDY